MDFEDIIHLEVNKLNRGRNTLILLIPSMIFVLILAIYLFVQGDNIRKQVAQTQTDIFILGEETELDIK